MANNERNMDERRDRNGAERDWQRRQWEQNRDEQGQQGMREFSRGSQLGGGQRSMYGGQDQGRYSERDYSGGMYEPSQSGRGSQFRYDEEYGGRGYGDEGYGGGRYGGYGGGFDGDRGDWTQNQFTGPTSRGYQRGMDRQQMGGYGSDRGYFDDRRNQGGIGSRYGFSGREQGGGMYGGQSRSGEYGRGGWNDDMGYFGADMWNRDIQNRRNRNMRGGDMMGDERNFAGRGPRGYSRSPERIREEVCEFITDDPQIDASHIELKVLDDGVVELSGEVDSRRTKRRIEDCCDSVRGVKDVRNNLSINSDFHNRSRSSNGSSSNGATSSTKSQKKS